MKRRVRVRLEFKLADMWIGAYSEHNKYRADIWICLIPCVPLHFWWLK